MLRHRYGLLAFVAVSILFVALSGCGSSSSPSSSNSGSSSSTTHHCSFLKKAGIVTRLGIAGITFKKWVYNPWQNGTFKKGAPRRALHIAGAVATTLFDIHEAKKAITKAKECGAGAKIMGLLGAIESRLGALKSGGATGSDSFVSSQVQGMNSSFNAIKSDEHSL